MIDMVMSFGGFPWLTLIVFLPLAGAIVLIPLKDVMAKWVALGVSSLVLFASLPLWILFDVSTSAMQFFETHQWIAPLSIEYAVGVDGISLPLVLLTTMLTPLCIVVSWTSIETRVKEFMISLLVMETATIGVFVALDFVLFYVFWEMMLIPMYLLIGVWGGPNRVYAAIKFFLYTLAGSVLLLVAIIVLYVYAGEQSFNILTLSQATYPSWLQAWVFWAFFAAFAVKVPMFPLHTWLPDAHVEAPTAGSVILASVLLKLGTYGFLRFSLPMLPDATRQFAAWVMILSVVAIVYGAYMALAQSDLKKLIAYSSVSHMGFVTLGIFVLNAQGIEGAILQMVNHGITTGALFLCVGILYERTHSRAIVDNSGLAKSMPMYATFLMIFALSSVGLPGMNGFVGEFLILLGVFVESKLAATCAALGVVLAAAYIFWMLQRVVYGEPASHMASKLRDLNWREIGLLAPLAVLVFWIGLYPKPMLDVMHASVDHLVHHEANVMFADDAPAFVSPHSLRARSSIIADAREAARP